MKQLLTDMVMSLITRQDDVIINEIKCSNNYLHYEISVHKEDRGRLIGKKGKTYQIIFEFMKIVASKNQKKINISILEDH